MDELPYSLVEKICPLCGAKSVQKVLNNPIQPSAYFLDGCPCGEAHEALPYLAYACPACGFVSRDFSAAPHISKEFIQSKDYQGLINPRIDEDTSKYARLALINIAVKNYPTALKEFLSAAWCADLYYDVEMAEFFRKKALDIWTASGNPDNFPKEMQIGLIDTMRRVGQFDEAQKLALKYLENADDTNRFALSFELELSSYEINTAKTTADIIHYARCKAQNIDDGLSYAISGKTYSASVDSYGPGWHWNSGLRVLTLLGYHGGSISLQGDVTILLESGEIVIRGEHKSCITCSGGDLTIISKNAVLEIIGDDDGIYADGKVIFNKTSAEIKCGGCGISAVNDVVITASNISGRSGETFIISSAGGLFVLCTAYVSGTGTFYGADSFKSSKLSTSVLKLESPKGTAFVVREGSHNMSLCMQTFIGSDYGLHIEKGSLVNGAGSNTEMSGNIALYVKHKFNINTGTVSAVGKDCGIFAGDNISISNGAISVSGDTGIQTCGDFDISFGRCNVRGLSTGFDVKGSIILNSGRIDASAESGNGVVCSSNLKMTDSSIISAGSKTGLIVSGNVEKIKGGITASGDTALKINGNLLNSGGVVAVDGVFNGIEIGGDCQNDGKITAAGKTSCGIQIGGIFRNLGGEIDVFGKECGFKTKGDAVIIGSVSATGKTGAQIGGSLNTDIGTLRFSGDEIGLNVAGGDFSTGDAVLIEASGDVGVYIKDNFIINGGVLQISGEFCGVVIAEKDAVLNRGSLEITGEEYGMLIQKGSMKVGKATVSVSSESTGICLDKGDVVLDAMGIFVSGKKYGIDAPEGSVILNAPLDSFGGDCAVIAKNIRIREGTLDAKSDKHNGTALIADEISSETDIVIIAGDKLENSEVDEYDGESYLHIYPKHHFRLSVAAEVENLEIVFKWMEKSLIFCGVSQRIISQMMLVIEEFFVNIARYAYQGEKGNADFILYCGDNLKLVISDEGIEFDPLSLSPPDSKTPIHERTAGGWGIHLSRKLTDKITYERDGKRNVLTIYKYL